MFNYCQLVKQKRYDSWIEWWIIGWDYKEHLWNQTIQCTKKKMRFFFFVALASTEMIINVMYNWILFRPHSSSNISHDHMIAFNLSNYFQCTEGKKFTCTLVTRSPSSVKLKVKGGFYLVGPKTCCFFWNFFLGKYDRYENEILASCRVQFIEATQFFRGWSKWRGRGGVPNNGGMSAATRPHGGSRRVRKKNLKRKRRICP